jgi:branched-chain amino acid transport system permease protein/urea transport system permease protein
MTSISGLILVASGLTIIFGLMGILNLSHGAFMMVGAYVAFGVQDLGLSAWAAIIIAPVIVGLLGILIEATLIKRLYDRPIDTLLATWGVAIALQELVTIVFGTSQKDVTAPLQRQVAIAGTTYPAYWLFIILTAAVVMAITLAIFKYTDIGVMARAVIQNRQMAASLGINTDLSDRLTFGFGAGLAGLSGAIMAPLLSVTSNMGVSWLADSFLVVIVGGVGSFIGTIVGGVFLGGLDEIFRTLSSGNTAVAQAAVLVIAVLAIRYRPDGLINAGTGGE